MKPMRFKRLRRFGLLAGLLPLLAIAGWTAPSGTAFAKNPYAGQGMWIWYISSSEKGDLGAIVRRAKASRIKTLYIKSADGTGTWSQFTSSMVKRFHRAGLQVCGWQYVYGSRPAREAAAAAQAKRRGADCLVIDAEAEYEGRYAAADRYIRTLRRKVGPKFRLSLAGFPYNQYHQAYPYSVFLGPGAATASLPQVYWKAIGDPVSKAIRTTWQQNTIYKRPIYPLGQTWMNPGAKQLLNFRRYARSYGAAPSWWSWQETSRSAWRALGRKVGRIPGFRPVRDKPVIRAGSRGDAVVWLQQHLVGAGYDIPINGIFGRKSQQALKRFQHRKGLEADAVAGTATWNRIMRVTPVRVHWSAGGSAGSSGARVSGPAGTAPRRPLSADIPMVRNEIAGAGKPGR